MKKRLMAALMALCMLAGMLPGSLPAHAESYAVYIISNTLKAYKSKSTSSKSMGTMSYGEKFTCVATSGDWAKIKNDKGAVAYCKKSGLSTENPNNLNGKVTINTANTKVYAKPLTSAKVMMKLKKGSKYTAKAVTADGKWYRLQNGKYYGYVLSKYIDDGSSGGNNDNSFSQTVYVTANSAKVYKSPSTSSSVRGTMYFGQKLTCTNISGNWAKVKGTYSGYCKVDSLSDINPNDLNYKIKINTANTKVYAIPSTSGRVMMKLKKGSKYTALGITSDGKWYRLQNGKYYGYVLSKYIDDDRYVDNEDETPEDGETTVYISDNTLKAYQKASSDSKVLGTMSFGESYLLLSVDDGWAKIKNSDGTIGYCLYGGLSTTDPNTLNDTYYAQRDEVKMYEKPLTSANVIKTLKTDAAVTVVAINSDGDWMRIKNGNGYGYMRAIDINKEMVGVVADPNAIVDCDPKTVYIEANTLVVYQKNSTTSKALGTMSFGEKLTRTGQGGVWARVKNEEGETGFCKLSGLTEKNPNTYDVTLYVQKNNIKMYAKPSTSATVLETMAVNTKLTGLCLSEDEDWVRAKTAKGEIGYVQSKSLSGSKVNTDTSKADAVVALAKKQLDKKYVYAAEGPDNFDCSGLTYYVFKKAAGITLKRTAYQQGYDDRYEKISSISSLRVGDLVFFNTSSDSDLCDHSGIYLGGNQFIHASSAGGKVMISSLSSKASGGYYYKNFSWGRRVLK